MHTEQNLDEILSLGGMDIIEQCMKKFPGDRRLTVCGGVALRNLRNRLLEKNKAEDEPGEGDTSNIAPSPSENTSPEE